MANLLYNFFLKNRKAVVTISTAVFVLLFMIPFITTKRVERNQSYLTKEEVALYIKQYHELPPNYITNYGLQYMDNHGIDSKDYVMGGDTHINTGTLASFGVTGTDTLKECDIVNSAYSIKGNRGKQRFVYTCNTDYVRVFYTKDHYTSFQEITSFELQLVRNIFWIIFGVYATVYSALFICVKVKERGEINVDAVPASGV